MKFYKLLAILIMSLLITTGCGESQNTSDTAAATKVEKAKPAASVKKNKVPIANAGVDQTVLKGATVTLDGSASKDLDGTIENYSWSYNGTTLAGVQPTFIAENAGTFTITLTVTDDRGATDTDTMILTVNDTPPPPANIPPAADAGADQTVTKGVTVTLDGSGSSDSDGTITDYSWAYNGTTLTGVKPTFTAATVGAFTITLTVTDNAGATATDTMILTVNDTPPPPSNVPPVANAGADQTVTRGATVTLNAEASSDSDGMITDYSWSYNGTTLTGANPSFTADTVGSFTITLTVTDDGGATDTDTMTLTVNAPAVATGPNVLVLYDASGPYGWLGKATSIITENLLGHFDANVTSKQADGYSAGELQRYKAVIYLGTTYDTLSYYADGSEGRNNYMSFFHDIAEYPDVSVIWINYNLWLLEQAWVENQWNGDMMSNRTGFGAGFIESTLPYNRVGYKYTELFKGVVPYATPGADVSTCVDEGNNRYACTTELVNVNILDENKTTVWATAYSTLDSSVPVKPYITSGGNFWFIGDVPYFYMSEEDRYLAFADLLHDMLGVQHEESHKALMRLEDVSAMTDENDLRSILDYMDSQNVPFSIATIAEYEDPYGIENEGVPTSYKLNETPVGYLLKDYYDQGLIEIVQHGATHQLFTLLNPYNGLTGDDFEFMRVVEIDIYSPYIYTRLDPEYGGEWALNRMLGAKAIINNLGMQAFAWEAPHYMAGPDHYKAIQTLYQVQYARLLYYLDEDSIDPVQRNSYIGQFYPYVIKRDIYGYYIIPENIHNIEDQPNYGYRVLTVSDLLNFATKMRVVRDGIASFYYHPYLGTKDLSKLVPGIKNLGFTFVKASSLIE